MSMSTTEWTKARKSGTNGGSCVEMRRSDGMVEVRDSKHPNGPKLRFTYQEVDAWLDGARNNEFDHLVGD